MVNEILQADKDKAGFLAALESIRLARYMPFKEFKEKIASLNTSSETLRSDRFKAGFNYIVTGIYAIEFPTGHGQVKIGFESAGKFKILESATVANAEDSVSWTGEIILNEGEYVRVDFEGATAADTIQILYTGYQVRTGV